MVAQRGALRRERREQRGSRFVTELGRGDEHGCSSAAEQVPDLTPSGARADADDREARLLAGEVDRVHARAVGEQHADRAHPGPRRSR